MFSKYKSVSRTISFRLTLGFCFLFVASSACIFLLTYGFFRKSLELKDHQIIEAKFSGYSVLLQTKGAEALKQFITNEVSRNESTDYFIRLQDRSHETVFLQMPRDENLDHTYIEERLKRYPKRRAWLNVPILYAIDKMEILSASVGHGFVLQLGKRTKVREEILQRFRDLFSLVMLISISISVLAGILLSWKTLSPIRRLIATIRSIQAGDETARVENKKTGDELEILTTLFNEMLDRIQRLITGMHETVDNIAHDVRTPVTRFRMIAEMALLSENELTRKEALEEGAAMANDIHSLLDTLLDISEAESGAMNLNYELLSVRDICREAIDLYEFAAQEKNISIKLRCPARISYRGDYNRIKQVVANLLDNAVKYTPENGSIAINVYSDHDKAILSVEDTGQGIAPDEIPKIWDRLYRADGSRSQRGLGLGLSLVRSIVLAHGGSVSVISEPNRGSSFEIQLPHKIADL